MLRVPMPNASLDLTQKSKPRSSARCPRSQIRPAIVCSSPMPQCFWKTATASAAQAMGPALSIMPLTLNQNCNARPTDNHPYREASLQAHRLPRHASFNGSGLMATYLVVFAMLACPMSFWSLQASISPSGRVGGRPHSWCCGRQCSGVTAVPAERSRPPRPSTRHRSDPLAPAPGGEWPWDVLAKSSIRSSAPVGRPVRL
jgi:hypothetical protein